MISLLRKSIALLVGIPILALGVILIPLPGPGLLVMLAGLLILSLEFEWARRHRDKIRDHLRTIIDKQKAKIDDAKR